VNITGDRGHCRKYKVQRPGQDPYEVHLCKRVDANKILQISRQGYPSVPAAQRRLSAISGQLASGASGAPTNPLPTDATTNVEMQGADGALGPQHDGTWSPDPGDYIEPMAQQTFWNDTVKKLLPARRPTGGSGQPATVGEWKLGAGLFHHPPEPKDGMPISIAALCLVPVFVWAPTLLYSSVVVRHFRQDGQAPCPLGGWGHDTIHKSFASRHVYAELHLT
jgi:hypothetical protein